MPKRGIALPFQTNGRGRLVLCESEEQLRKIIMLNLMNLDSDNPFQSDLGLGAEMIFALQSEQLKAELRRRINATFRRLQLQNRARLAKQPVFTERSETQELEVNISYINLEENKEDKLSLVFSPNTPGKSLARSFQMSVSKMPGLIAGAS